METLTPKALEYVRRIPVREEHVGKVKGRGGANTVVEYGGKTPRVLKLPTFRIEASTIRAAISKAISPRNADSAKREIDLYQQYFEKWAVWSEVRASREAYGVLQPEISIEPLTPKHCKQHPFLERELEYILEQNRKLQLEQNYFVDLQGFNTTQLLRLLFAGEGECGNISVERNVKGEPVGLRMFDPGVLPRNASMVVQYMVQDMNLGTFNTGFRRKRKPRM